VSGICRQAGAINLKTLPRDQTRPSACAAIAAAFYPFQENFAPGALPEATAQPLPLISLPQGDHGSPPSACPSFGPPPANGQKAILLRN
jgi:hypothetical protein